MIQRKGLLVRISVSLTLTHMNTQKHNLGPNSPPGYDTALIFSSCREVQTPSVCMCKPPQKTSPATLPLRALCPDWKKNKTGARRWWRCSLYLPPPGPSITPRHLQPAGAAVRAAVPGRWLQDLRHRSWEELGGGGGREEWLFVQGGGRGMGGSGQRRQLQGG